MKKKWIAWAAASTGAFLALELPAVFNSIQGDTLSEHVWGLPDVYRFGIVGFLVWLTAHFASKGKV